MGSLTKKTTTRRKVRDDKLAKNRKKKLAKSNKKKSRAWAK